MTVRPVDIAGATPHSPWPWIALVAIAIGGMIGWASLSSTSTYVASPLQAPGDSPAQSTMAAAAATGAFVPTSTVTPTRTATVAPTETVGPTVLPYCKTIQEGVCLMYEQGQSLPTATLRPCSATTPSPILELPCDKYPDGLDARQVTK